MADDGGGDAGERTVFLVGEKAGVGEGERDVLTGGDGRGKRDENIERIGIVAAEGDRLAVGGLDVGDDEIRMELEINVAGDLVSDEIHFGDGAEGLTVGVKRGGNVVMSGDETDGTGRGLSVQPGGRNGEGEEGQQGSRR